MIDEINVYKFGGTSQKDYETLERCAHILANDEYAGTVVVSAPSGVTDLLKLAANSALERIDYPIRYAEEIMHKYENVTAGISCGDDFLVPLWEALGKKLTNPPKTVNDQLRKKYVADVLSLGEEYQSKIFTRFLKEQGFTANLLPINAIKLDGDYLDGVYDRRSDERIRRNFREGEILVVPGFIGLNGNGERIVFDRGGSDFTQALAARALGATACYNCTDVDGVKQINPKLLPENEREKIKTIEFLNYFLAQELSRQGAKVLHPRCLEPLMETDIPMYVMNTFNPGGLRTKIYDKPLGEPGFIAVTGKVESFKNITLHTGAMEGKSGYVKLFAEALEGVDLDTLTTSSTEITASFSGNIENHEEIRRRLEQYGRVTMSNGLAQIAMVGENIGRDARLIGKMFEVLGDNGIPVNSQISKANNYSVWIGIPSGDFARAKIALYNELLKKAA
ncbi:MAG: hypothetical protein ACP5N3_05020 [Candidatus Nanoarchaeia archaeon]